MSIAILWSDFVAWSVQVFILSATACLAARLLRIAEPKSRLIGAQVALLACALFPVLEPRLAHMGNVDILTSDDLDGPMRGKRLPSVPVPPWKPVLLGVIAAGAAVRLILLGAGVRKLRSYRRSSRTLNPVPGPVSEACVLTRTKCRLAINERTQSPATFGLFRPMILLPPKFLDLSDEAQRAIACHELLHVQRKDWMAALAEECAGALLWFQPAVYLLIADIRLAREKVVDQLAVDVTRAKAPYVDALLAVAATPVGAMLTIAPMFLQRRNLKSRVKFLIEELSMSKRKLIVANVSLAALLGVAAWVSMASFPLTAAPQEKDSQQDKQKSSEPKAGSSAVPDWDFSKAFPPGSAKRIKVGGNVMSSNLISQVKPAYPPEAKAQRVQGQVKLGILVGTDGHVEDLVLISGHPLLTPTASDAVRQWIYRPALLNGDPVEVISVVDVNFTLEK